MRRGSLLAVLLLLPLLHSVGSQAEDRWPRFEIETPLFAPDGQDGDRYGEAVATDGERLLIGAPGAQDGGKAYVYVRDGSSWSVESELTPGAPTAGAFGSAVAIQGDWAFVGAPSHAAGPLAPEAGRIDIFHRTHAWQFHSSWTCDEANARCGEALATDENRIFVGIPGNDLFAGSGSVQVYAMSNLQPTHTFDGQSTRRFGADLDTDGRTLVIGAPARTGTDSIEPGRAYFFERVGSTWFDRGMIEADTDLQASHSFGSNVAVDGADAVITTIAMLQNGLYIGGDAFIYERSGTEWRHIYTEYTELETVALHDGIMLLGAWYWDTILVLKKIEGDWYWIGWLGDFGFEGSQEEDFGVAMAFHDRAVVIGSPLESHDASATGGAFAFYDNWPPHAYAGWDRTIDDLDNDKLETIVLDGNSSYDWDGEIVSYVWRENGEVISRESSVEVTRPIGTHMFELEVTDDLGAKDTDVVAITVRIPTTAAWFDVWPQNPQAGSWVYFEDLSQDLRAPIKEWSWDFNGDGYQDSTARYDHYTYDLGGTYEATLTTVNEDGQSLSVTREVHVRNSNPVAHAGAGQIHYDVIGATTVTLDASNSYDDDEIVSWEWWGAGFQSMEGEQVDVTLTEGVHEFYLDVRDSQGRWNSDWTTVVVTSESNETAGEPTAAFTHEVWWGRNLDFRSESTPSRGDIAFTEWDFDGSGLDARGEDAYHQFKKPGAANVKLRVVQSDGGETVITEPVIVPNEPPAAFFWPSYAVVPVDTYLIFTAYTWDDGEVGHAWEFSDGFASNHDDVGHTFAEIGVVEIHMLATDDGHLESEATGEIEVVSLEEWERMYGEFDPNALLNATEEEPVEALSSAPIEPRVVEQDEEDEDDDWQEQTVDAKEPFEPKSKKVGGMAVWVIAFIALILVGLVLAVVPAIRRK